MPRPLSISEKEAAGVINVKARRLALRASGLRESYVNFYIANGGIVMRCSIRAPTKPRPQS